MTYVTNQAGYNLDYDTAVQLMDDDLREDIHSNLAPCTEQEFFDAYAAAHVAKYGEDWALNTTNLIW